MPERQQEAGSGDHSARVWDAIGKLQDNHREMQSDLRVTNTNLNALTSEVREVVQTLRNRSSASGWVLISSIIGVIMFVWVYTDRETEPLRSRDTNIEAKFDMLHTMLVEDLADEVRERQSLEKRMNAMESVTTGLNERLTGMQSGWDRDNKWMTWMLMQGYSERRIIERRE